MPELKTEQKVKEELREMLKQRALIAETNPTAHTCLTNRAIALVWVLETDMAPAKLTFSKERLEFLEALY